MQPLTGHTETQKPQLMHFSSSTACGAEQPGQGTYDAQREADRQQVPAGLSHHSFRVLLEPAPGLTPGGSVLRSPS